MLLLEVGGGGGGRSETLPNERVIGMGPPFPNELLRPRGLLVPKDWQLYELLHGIRWLYQAYVCVVVCLPCLVVKIK